MADRDKDEDKTDLIIGIEDAGIGRGDVQCYFCQHSLVGKPSFLLLTPSADDDDLQEILTCEFHAEAFHQAIGGLAFALVSSLSVAVDAAREMDQVILVEAMAAKDAPPADIPGQQKIGFDDPLDGESEPEEPDEREVEPEDEGDGLAEEPDDPEEPEDD